MPKNTIASKTNLTKAAAKKPLKAIRITKKKPKDVFEKHKPDDNFCKAAVKFQTKKAARELLETDPTAELYIKTFKSDGITKEAIFKSCSKTRQDSEHYCWKHAATEKSTKHPFFNFDRDIIEQLGKTARRATLEDNFLQSGSVASRRPTEEKLLSTQPVFTIRVTAKLLEDLVRIHDQIKDTIEAGLTSSSSSDEEKEAEADTSSEEEDSDEETKDEETAEETEEETDDESDGTEPEVETEIVYSSTGKKYHYDEKDARIIDMNGTVVGDLEELNHEEAPFDIDGKKYIVRHRIKINGLPHTMCKITNLVFNNTQNLIGRMITDDGKRRLVRI